MWKLESITVSLQGRFRRRRGQIDEVGVEAGRGVRAHRPLGAVASHGQRGDDVVERFSLDAIRGTLNRPPMTALLKRVTESGITLLVEHFAESART